MLTASPTKYGAGITLWGDYYDLKAIHSTISFLSEKTDAGDQIKNYVLALAYDVRHAYQCDRETKVFGMDSLDKVTYRGVSILWPFFLSQLAILRGLAAFVPHTAFEQANLYLLENCARMALMEYDAEVGTTCLAWLETPPPFGRNYLVEFIDSATKTFVLGSRPGKKRFQQLPTTLRSLSMFSKEYQAFKERLEGIAAEQNCSPHQLADWSEWPDFKW